MEAGSAYGIPQSDGSVIGPSASLTASQSTEVGGRLATTGEVVEVVDVPAVVDVDSLTGAGSEVVVLVACVESVTIAGDVGVVVPADGELAQAAMKNR